MWNIVEVSPDSTLSKSELQQILHAVEELYFFRRYDEGVTFLQRVFAAGDASTLGLDKSIGKTLKVYEKRCMEKMRQEEAVESVVLHGDVANLSEAQGELEDGRTGAR